MSLDCPIKILHFTDFHIGTPISPEQRRAIIELMDAAIQDAQGGVNAVIVTGDIATGGMAAGYRAFKELVVDRLTTALPPPPVFWIVPGNHDHDLSASLPRNQIEQGFRQGIDQPAATAFRATLSARLYEYRTALPHPHASPDWLLQDGAFCDVLRLGSLSVGVVGLNTGWLLDGAGSGTGEGTLDPGCGLLEMALRRLVNENIGIRLVLGHHPLSWFTPHARTNVQKVLRQYEAIYLHGHYHIGDAQFDVKKTGTFIALQARAANLTGRRGAATGGMDAYGGYSLLTFTPNAEEFRVLPRVVVKGSCRSDSSAYAGDDVALQPETDGSFIFPLPTTQAFSRWLYPLRDNWERYDPVPPQASADPARWRCYLMGSAPDRTLAAALPMGPTEGMAHAAWEKLTADSISCLHPCRWAWIEAPYGEGGSTARLQVMHQMSDWVIYRHKPNRPLTLLPLERLTQSEGKNHKILVVVDNATRYPADVVALMDDATHLSAPDRIAFLLGGDPLERAQLPSHYAASIPFCSPPPAWDHSRRPTIESWVQKAPDAGLPARAAQEAMRVFGDTIMKPAWSWLGGMLAFDKLKKPGWSINSQWPTFSVEHARKTLSKKPLALKALALVAAAHAKEKACVTPPVMAQALGINPMRLESEIIPALAAEIRRPQRSVPDDEREPPETEEVWLTRHCAIAELYTGLDPGFQPLPALLDSVETLWRARNAPAFGCDWIDLAATAQRLPTLGNAGDWPSLPASWAIRFGEHCRDSRDKTLLQSGVQVLDAALSKDANRTDCPGLFAMLATLLALTARTPQEKTDAVLAALAALRDVPRTRDTAKPTASAVKKGVHDYSYAVLSRLVPEIRPNFPAADLQNLELRKIDKTGSDHTKPYVTLRSLSDKFSSGQNYQWQKNLAPPSLWIFPNPYFIGD